jgi:hypothetical protein
VENEGGQTFIGECAYVAAPSLAVFDKGDKGIDVGSTPSAAGYDGVGDYGDGILLVAEGEIGADRKGKGKLCLFEEGVALRYTTEGAAHVFRRTIRVGRVCYRRLSLAIAFCHEGREKYARGKK